MEVEPSIIYALNFLGRSSWYVVWWNKLKESVGRFHQEMHYKTLLMGAGSFVH